MKKLRAGIVGCGIIFPMHAHSIRALENVEIAAVCDIKADRAKEIADRFDCKYYSDYKDMIDNADIDVVHICTPHYLHAPIAICAAENKKHVLTEKPMAISLKDAEAMVCAHKQNGTTLGVIFQNRYNPGSLLIKDTLDSGKLGKIKSGKFSVTWHRSNEYYSESDWRGTLEKEGGGVIINQSIHTFDLMNWFVSSEIEYVDVNIGNRAHFGIEVEDVAEGLIHYKNNIDVGFFAMTYYSYDAPIEIELHCEKGIAKMIADKAIIKFDDGQEFLADKNPNEVFSYGDGEKDYWGVSHLKQIRNFYDCIEKGVSPDITGEVALKTQKLICAVYDSGRKKEKIILS